MCVDEPTWRTPLSASFHVLPGQILWCYQEVRMIGTMQCVTKIKRQPQWW
jgi:hypothetical protein